MFYRTECILTLGRRKFIYRFKIAHNLHALQRWGISNFLVEYCLPFLTFNRTVHALRTYITPVLKSNSLLDSLEAKMADICLSKYFGFF